MVTLDILQTEDDLDFSSSNREKKKKMAASISASTNETMTTSRHPQIIITTPTIQLQATSSEPSPSLLSTKECFPIEIAMFSRKWEYDYNNCLSLEIWPKKISLPFCTYFGLFCPFKFTYDLTVDLLDVRKVMK